LQEEKSSFVFPSLKLSLSDQPSILTGKEEHNPLPNEELQVSPEVEKTCPFLEAERRGTSIPRGEKKLPHLYWDQ